ncbi:MAG: PP2C family protein-serine/threonine phosphatase [Gemmatimonadales bacterium]
MAANAADEPGARSPSDRDVDAYGITHQGLVRNKNEDHFFIGALSKEGLVDRTSLPPEGRPQTDGPPLVAPDRMVSLAIVADGVGSGGGGEEASRVAVQVIVEHLAQNFRAADAAESSDPEVFIRLLSDAALECHERLVGRSEEVSGSRRFATTLTLWLGLWPHGYLLQVGDSRCYMFRDGKLTQISRDQTMAQELIDQGVLTQTRAHSTRWAHVLSSAIGGQQAAPVVTRITRAWGTVLLLCSDGLTKHVPDEQIRDRLANLTSAKQVCEDLLQDALDDGGSDNITLIVGRTIEPA